MTSNKYESYNNDTFSYDYPFEWEKRNKDYLKTVETRPNLKQYIDPLVYRLRFYDINDSIISDSFYTPNNDVILFPEAAEVTGKVFVGWEFEYNGSVVVITKDDYSSLTDAINNNYDDIKLKAKYESLG